MRISSWNFVRVPKAMFWAHVQVSFQLEILRINVISSILDFRKIILESARNVSEVYEKSYPVTHDNILHDNTTTPLLIGSQQSVTLFSNENNPDSKVHGVNMGPIWGWQDPGGPHVGPMLAP